MQAPHHTYDGPQQSSARRRLTFTMILALIWALVVMLPGSATATNGPFDGIFEIDGNLDLDDGDSGAIDWNSFALLDQIEPTGTVIENLRAEWNFARFDDATAKDDDQFSGGVKQDDACAPTRESSFGGGNSKFDLARIYLANKNLEVEVGGETENHEFLFLSWVRVPSPPTASSHIGYEFNKGTGGLCNENPDLLKRVEGDLLLIYDFEGGAADPSIRANTWITPESANGKTCEVKQSSPPCWSPVTIDDTSWEAEVNKTTANGGPGTVTDAIAGEDLQPVRFGEAGIDLHAAGLLEEECGGFGYVSAISRSSGNSGNAQMKDLVGPHRFSLAECTGSLVVHKLDGEGEFLSGADFEVVPSSAVTGTDPLTYPSDDAVPMIDGEATVTIDDTPTAVNGGVHCVDGLTLEADFTIVETAAPDGYDLPATVHTTATVSDDRTCDERRADPDNEPDATFINVAQPGDVEIVKRDDANNPVAGAVFELFEATKTVVGGETTYTVGDSTGRECATYVGLFNEGASDEFAAAGDCYEFDPSGPVPTEPDEDDLGFQSLPPGSYCIQEVVTPTGYEAAPFDQDTHCFDIGITAGGDTVGLTIENPRLHRIIVLVCHEGQTPVLHQSDVTLTVDSGPDVSLSSLSDAPGDLTDAALCDLGGATFGGLGHDTYDLEVDTDTH